MKQKVFVIGLGLIGGSIAKNIKENHKAEVLGYDSNPNSVEKALSSQVIDQGITSIGEGAILSDFILLATPIDITLVLLEQLFGLTYDKPVIISDVCSVKNQIVEKVNQLDNPNIRFVGGHPMAGSHKKGIEAAKSHLFENAFYVLCPTRSCKKEDLLALEDLLSSTKSHFVEIEAPVHDQLTAVISHFPHLIASSLVHQAKKWNEQFPFLNELAAGGFRDITRIASSNPSMWQSIFSSNKEYMLPLLDDWIHEMKGLKDWIESEQKGSMLNYLSQAKEFRDTLPSRKGAIPSFYDLYVDIQDQPGALAKVTNLLAKHDISIVNIQILETREGLTGALRISFQTMKDRLSSQQILQADGYETSIGE
ncbi:prephenate dehydrogenase [Bacillaceae bacterium S4-13-58]